MGRLAFSFFVLVLGLTGCAPPPPTLGSDGKPLPRVYTIDDVAAVSFGMLDSVNALRQAADVPDRLAPPPRRERGIQPDQPVKAYPDGGPDR